MHGILNPTVTCNVRLDENSEVHSDALAALQFSLFIPCMNHFAATFTGTKNQIRLSNDLGRCRRILLKFPSVCHVSVEFEEIAYDVRLLTSGGMRDPVKCDFLALLGTIADLLSVESVRIVTGWHFDKNYMLELFPSVIGLTSSSQPVALSLLKKSLKLIKATFPRRSRRAPTLSITAPRTAITFRIDTPILSLPAFYARTMLIISSRSITSLQVHMLIAAVDWAIILSDIAAAVPHLAELTLLGVRMPIAALIQSIQQFPELNTLATDSTPDFFMKPSFRVISPALPNSSIAAGDSPSALIELRRRCAFLISTPHLANLTTLATRPEHLEALLQTHAPLPALASLCPRLELLDLNSPAMTLLMRRIVLRIRRTHKSIPVLLDICANISPEALMCRTLDIALSQGNTWDEAFGSIENLRVRDYGEYSGIILARWNTIFRGVTSISLAGMVGSPASLKYTRTELRRTCPNVRGITFEGMAMDTEIEQLEIAGGSTGFLELPDDVLQIIFRQLGPVQLYGTSRLSRRLNLLALPEYLAQKDVPDPRKLCKFRLLGAIPARDQDVSCHFKPGGHVFCYLQHIERLTVFVSKFPSVGSVSLELVDLGNVDGEENELVRTRWRVLFGKLLNVILEMSCKKLTISGPPYLKSSTSEPPWPKDEARVALSTKSSAVRVFSFYPTMDLSHSGILWTFSALRSSEVSVLNIAVTSTASLEVVSRELPALQELAVTACDQILNLNLIELLCKLTHLTRLTIPLKGTTRGTAPFAEATVPTFRPCARSQRQRLDILTSSPSILTLPPTDSIVKIIDALAERGPVPWPAITLDVTLSWRTLIYPAWSIADRFTALVGADESWRSAAKVVRGLAVRSSSIDSDSLGAACGEVLEAFLPHLPALREVSVDDGTGERMLGRKAVFAVVSKKCPGVESVKLNDTQVFPIT
ncbi:hypothetical protein B0H19DRAFT_1381079 [Mycena capillaripes]|nr:hypothetical protein B0H19DRAFT_1381079 [Mycena capillaripes]